MCRDHLFWGNVESEISSKEKSVVCSVALFLSLSHKRWRRLTRRTKKREREQGFYRARSHISASLVFLQARLFASERSSLLVRSIRLARRMRAEHVGTRRRGFVSFAQDDDDEEDAIFGRIHPRRGNFDDDFDE